MSIKTVKPAKPANATPSNKVDAKKKELPPVDNSPEAKAARFKKIASRRTQKIVATLNNLGNCSNRNVYGYTPEQIKMIFDAIKKQLTATEEKFAERIESVKKPEFKLD